MGKKILSRPLHGIAVLIALVGVSVMTVYWVIIESSFAALRANTLAQHERHAIELADAIAQSTENLVRGIDIALQRLRDDYLDEADEFEQTVRSVRDSFPAGAVMNIAVINATGYRTYSVIHAGAADLAYSGGRDHFRHLVASARDELWIGKPRLGSLSKVWVSVFARKIMRRGRFAGVVLLSLRSDYIGNSLARLALHSADVISLIDPDGAFFSRSVDLQNALGKSLPRDRPFLAADAPRSGVFRAVATHDRIPRILAWRRLDGVPLIAGVGVAIPDTLAPVEAEIAKSRRTNLVGSALIEAALVLVVALILKIGRQRRRIDEDDDALRIAKTAFDAAAEGIIVTDGSKRILSVNPAFTRITGYSAAEVIGRTPRVIASGRHDADFYARMWSRINAEGEWDGEVTNRHKDGRLFVEWLKIRTIPNDDPEHRRYVAVITDVTQRKEQEEEGWRHANFDPLTGLPNRRLLLDRLQRAVTHAERNRQRLAVLFVDIDEFKPVNDRYGHQAGDRLLTELASRLVLALRDEDTVGRLAGDEFVVLLPSLRNEPDALLVGQKLLQALREPFLVEGDRVAVSASIGVALFPGHGRVAEEMIGNADAAMYRAKQAGGNAVRLVSAEVETS